MSKKNQKLLSTILPMQKYNYCMDCPILCENSYMQRDQMMPEYNSEDSEDGYRPGQGGGHGPGGNPGQGGGHGPGGNPGQGGGHGPGGNPG
ncbi:MAG TPA: hypothetical protein VIM70_03415, partial [Clostridium sp.]|uniref:hypothetical protein n=1 Tax=Clostridium sp. TaxID=1506 RepID=UPI002F954408